MSTPNQLAALRDTIELAQQHDMFTDGGVYGLDHMRKILVQAEVFNDAKTQRWLRWSQAAAVGADIGITDDDIEAINTRHGVC